MNDDVPVAAVLHMPPPDNDVEDEDDVDAAAAAVVAVALGYNPVSSAAGSRPGSLNN